MTGCAAALLLARAGTKVILVEARRIGRGRTAASTALLMQEPDVDFAELARRYGPAVTRRVWRCNVMVWDTGRPYHYLQWTPDHRLLFGGLDRPRLRNPIRPAALRAKAAQLTRDLIDLYPSLEGIEPEFAWDGLFATTPDGLPYVGPHRRYPRQLFALGYGGNGMTLGFFAAQAIVRFVQGKPTADDRLFAFGRP